MDKLCFLSHSLTKKIPAYGNDQTEVIIKPVKSIPKGDSCNTFWIGIENHWGTHIDAPAHFFSTGQNISEYPAETWVFRNPAVIQIGLKENEILAPERLNQMAFQDKDLLLIRSGFQKYRGTPIYCNQNPGIDPELGFWLRRAYPSVKAVGFDFLSISSGHDRDLGRKAHRAFLDPEGENHPIFIIEDMDLAKDLTGLEQVWVLPLRIEGVDSAPCTVVGTIRGK